MADTVTLKAKQNRTFRARFTVKKAHNLRDLSNDTLTFAVYHTDTEAGVTGAEATTEAGITQSESGEATLTLNSAVMGFAKGTYTYELTITEGDTGETYTLLTGPFILENTYIS